MEKERSIHVRVVLVQPIYAIYIYLSIHLSIYLSVFGQSNKLGVLQSNFFVETHSFWA